MKKIILQAIVLYIIPWSYLLAQSNPDSIEAQLRQSNREERIQPLVALLNSYHKNNPQKALQYGREALQLLKHYPNTASEIEALTGTGWALLGINAIDSALVYAQRSEQLANETDNQVGTVKAAYLMGRIYRQRGQYDDAIAALKKGLTIVQDTDEFLLHANVLNEIGSVYRRQSKYDEALTFHHSALEINQGIDNKSGVASTLGYIGIIQDIVGNYDKALQFQQQALRLREELSDRRGVAGSLHNIGNLYQKIGDFDQALEFFQRALGVWRELDLQNELATTLNSIGAVHERRGDYEFALQYYQQALRLWEESGDKYSISIALNNVGAIHEYLGDYAAALKIHKRALKLRQEIGDRYGLAGSLFNTAIVYQKLAFPDSALLMGRRALELARQVKSWSLTADAHGTLSEIYESQGRYAEALIEYKHYKTAEDSLFNSESQSVIAELQEQYRTKEQQQRIELLQREQQVQRLWIAILIGGLSLSIVIGMLIFNRYRLRHRAHEVEARMHQAESEKARLRSEAAEAKAQYLQAENERKSKELEAARALQLSMLPLTLPNHPDYEIAAAMKTATEVGGDYYDFDLAPEGTLTVAIGDATGHGIPAGTIVTATKSLFNILSREPDLETMLRKASEALKKMRFQKLFMALALLRFHGDMLELIGAGMPSAIIVRASQNRVEEFPLKGLPLGSYGDFQYQLQRTNLRPGDIVLLLSDGFPESRNPQGEMIGFEFLSRELLNVTEKSAQEITQYFIDAATEWTDHQPFTDDMTFVVLKKKPSHNINAKLEKRQ